MKCAACGTTALALFRQNPKGEVGVWHCAPCTTAAVDPEVADLVAALIQPT